MGRKWITPFMKQAFVVTGVSLNMGSFGTVMGFTATLLPQLRASDSAINVDDALGSWIASIVGVSLLIGNLSVPTIMGKFGRKLASLFSCFITVACWLWITLASDVTSLLIARFLQGFSMGINLSLSPIMIGELTSPSNRGVLSSLMTAYITAATMSVHVIGSYLTWQTTALICAFIHTTGFAILIFTPESPSWLAFKGRYENSKKAYQWLRGYEEDDELEKMIEGRKAREVEFKASKDNSSSKLNYFVDAFRRKEFYKPVLIMIHLYIIGTWSGMCYLIVFTVDVIKLLAGEDVNAALQLTILDVQRMISTISAIYAVKTVKRRTFLFTTVGANIVILVVIAMYTLARAKGVLPFDHPTVGLVLIHIHMFTITTGALPLPVVISGELFPLEYRGLAGGISSISFSVNYFVTSKTAMYLLTTIGVHGAYLLSAGVTFYCLAVVWTLLPETRNKTLQDIEKEFKGKSKERYDDVVETQKFKVCQESNGNV